MSTDTRIPSPDPTSISDLYRQVWQHAAGARAAFAAALAMLGSSQVLKLALPWLAAQAINSLQTGGRAGLPQAGLWIAGILALHALSWALHGPARVMERGVALRVRRRAADALYARLVQAPLAWHEQHHSGDLQQRVAQASHALQSFTQTQFIYLQSAIQIVGPLLALWWLSTLTGALALAGFVLIGAAVLRFDRALLRLAVAENEAERRYAARLVDFVGNISAIASLRLQRATRALLDTRLVAAFAPLSRSIVINEWKWCLVDLSTAALGWGLVAVYALSRLLPESAGAAAGGPLLIGSLFMVHQYAQQAAGVLGSMAANYQSLAQVQADCASAAPILAAPVAQASLVQPRGALDDWQRIEIQGLAYQHAARTRGGIEGVSLALQRGERVALVGASGCGKSTLLRVLAGLYAAQQGRVVVDGVPQAGVHIAALATLIPQEAEVFEGSLRENLCLGQPVHDDDIRCALFTGALDETVARLPQGLQTPMAERGFNVSGGQRQRLALARGVLAARHSSVLLLDEPTSALDPATELLVQQRLHAAFEGSTVVAAVHRLALLPHFDRVAFMAAGRLVDIGTVAELQARQPAFAALCATAVPLAGGGMAMA